MGNFIYDIDVLKGIDVFDAAGASENFSSLEAYFESLDNYVLEWPHYLHGYNPTVAAYAPDTRAEFEAESAKIRVSLDALKMLSALRELDYVDMAMRNSDPKLLSDSLMTFHATLEIAAGLIVSARKQSGAPSNNEETAATTEKPIILAVDDMPVILAAIQKILEPEYKVISVQDADSALDAAERHSPALFLLDIEMPAMSGFELAETLRQSEKFKDAPILFLTGLSTREHVIEAKRLKINDYILKPVESDTLHRKIRYCLKQLK